MEQACQKLLDKSIPFNQEKVQILDQITYALYSGSDSSIINFANKVLNELKNDPDFWLATNTILEHSTNPQSKFLSLMSLEDAIKTQWQIIPQAQKDGIRQFIINIIINESSKDTKDKSTEQFLKKANIILVQIAKYEWNSSWKTFATDIIGSSLQNQNLCENNLQILKLLSEEIFDYSKSSLTSTQIRDLKMQMNNEFQKIFDLCCFVARQYFEKKSIKLSVVYTCLETLQSFMSWVPYQVLISQTMLQEILVPFLGVSQFRNQAFKCLTEVALVGVENYQQNEICQNYFKYLFLKENYQQPLIAMYMKVIEKMSFIFPPNSSLTIERNKILQNQKSHLDQFDHLCSCFAQFLTIFFKTHFIWIEKELEQTNNINELEPIRLGLQFITNLTDIQEESIFKICVEFWHWFCDYQLKSMEAYQAQSSQAFNQFDQNTLAYQQKSMTIKQMIYPVIFKQLRKIFISRMAKPQEVLIYIDEYGIPQKQFQENTEQNSINESLKDLLVQLSKLDWEDMKALMMSKLDRFIDGSDWSFDSLNSLCWSIGAIGGTLPDDAEKQFLITTIRTLLTLVELKKGKENKAVVASNIMYIVGQYPKFLKSNWNFLKTVVKKLFEFMHETFPGVMEMSINTFIKIAQSCPEQFVMKQQSKEDYAKSMYQQQLQQYSEPYLYEIIRRLPEETSMLDPELQIIFYEALGYMIQAEEDISEKKKFQENALALPYTEWKQIFELAKTNDSILQNEDTINKIIYFLKINDKLSAAIGNDYYPILQMLFIDLCMIYSYYSKIIAQQVSMIGKIAYNYASIKKVRSIKKFIIKLFASYVQSCTNPQFVAQNFLSSFIQMLEEYQQCDNDMKEPEILILFTHIIEKLNVLLGNELPRILQLTFNSTLSMITIDFNSYPDHRMNFFNFLKAIINNAFAVLFNIPQEQFQTMIQCVLWAVKHELFTIYDLGLDVLYVILENVNKEIAIAISFYEIYYVQILQDLLFVSTDSFHKNGFKKQVAILQILFQIIELGILQKPLFPNNQGTNNKQQIFTMIGDGFANIFSHVSKQQIDNFLVSLFKECNNYQQFKIIFRDYLVQLSQFSKDIEMLYGEDEKYLIPSKDQQILMQQQQQQSQQQPPSQQK